MTDVPLPPDGTADLTLDIAPNGTVAATLTLRDGGKVKKFTAKGDFVVAGYKSADAGESGRPAYAAFANLAFANLGLIHAEIALEVPADGKIRAENGRLVFVDRFAVEAADGIVADGDGQAWTPAVTVRGGASGFYTIRVEK